MARPIRWTRRLWKLASGQDRMQSFYSPRETPLLLAYWQALARQEARDRNKRDPLKTPIRRRLAEYKHRKQHGPDCDEPY